MAKQAVTPIERHVEKGVLGACGLALLAAIALFLVSSPNEKELGSGAVTPDTVYSTVADEASRYAQRAQREEVAVTADPPPVVPVLRSWMKDMLATAKLNSVIPPPVPLNPAVPSIGVEGPPPEKITLATLLPPASVKVACSGRTLAVLDPPFVLGGSDNTVPDPNASDFETAFNWVTVSGVFERAAQERLFRDAGYHPGRREHPIVGVDLQRREKHWDGSFSEWQDIPTYAPVVAPYPPAISIETVGATKTLTVPVEDRDALSYFADLVRDPQNQLDLLRPLFPIPMRGDYWKVPTYADLDLPNLDAEYQLAAALTPEDRYYDAVEPPVETASDTLDDEIADLEARQKRGFYTLTQAQEAETELKQLQQRQGLSRVQTTRLDELAISIAEDIKRLEKGEATELPAIPQAPQQIVWAHDAQSNSVISGRTYQYRMRLRLLNRYCGFPADMAEPTDAQKVVLATEWSEPTDPITIKQDTEFFLVSASADRIRAEVFKWVLGYWVKQTFDVEAGESIGGIKRVRLPGQEDSSSELVNFDTGAIVLAVDGNRTFRPLKAGSDDWSIQAPKSTVAITYVDANGQVQERLLEIDKNSPHRKEFGEWVRDTQPKPQPRPRQPRGGPPTGPPSFGPPGGAPPSGPPYGPPPGSIGGPPRGGGGRQ